MQLTTALSYNIHECVGRDGRRDPTRIAQVIRDSGAQIVGLQEVYSDTSGAEELHQMNYLAGATGLRPVSGPSIERQNGHYGNVLLTSHRILAVRKINLTYHHCEPRGAIDADLELHGERVRVIVTHLGLRGSERRYQVGKILAALAHRSSEAVMVMSDFNEWMPTGRPLRWIHSQLGKTALIRTFPSAFPIFALDRIWVSPPQALIALTRVRTPLTRIASDHLPLKAIIASPSAGGAEAPFPAETPTS
jgi:endonuclease/exonuclease/phosphatase family metal-dependent hydrolase